MKYGYHRFKSSFLLVFHICLLDLFTLSESCRTIILFNLQCLSKNSGNAAEQRKQKDILQLLGD